jgi:hypothetical protein
LDLRARSELPQYPCYVQAGVSERRQTAADDADGECVCVCVCGRNMLSLHHEHRHAFFAAVSEQPTAAAASGSWPPPAYSHSGQAGWSSGEKAKSHPVQWSPRREARQRPKGSSSVHEHTTPAAHTTHAAPPPPNTQSQYWHQSAAQQILFAAGNERRRRHTSCVPDKGAATKGDAGGPVSSSPVPPHPQTLSGHVCPVPSSVFVWRSFAAIAPPPLPPPPHMPAGVKRVIMPPSAPFTPHRCARLIDRGGGGGGGRQEMVIGSTSPRRTTWRTTAAVDAQSLVSVPVGVQLRMQQRRREHSVS